MDKTRREISEDLRDYENPSYGDSKLVHSRVGELKNGFESAFAQGEAVNTLRSALNETYYPQVHGEKKIRGWWAIARKLLGGNNTYVRVPLQNVVVQHGLGTEIALAIPNNMYDEIANFLLDSAALVESAKLLDENVEVTNRIHDLWLNYRESGGDLTEEDFRADILDQVDRARRHKQNRSIAPDSIMQYFSRVVVPVSLRCPSETEIHDLLDLNRRVHQMMIAGINPTAIHNLIRDNEQVQAGATIARSLDNPFTVAMRTSEAINLYMEDQQYVTIDDEGNEHVDTTGDDRLVWFDWSAQPDSNHVCDILDQIPELSVRDIYSCYIICLNLFHGQVINVNSIEDLRRYHSIGLAYVPALSLYEGADESSVSEAELNLFVRRIIMYFYVRNTLSRVRGPISGEMEQRYSSNIFRARESVDLEGLTRLLQGLSGWFDALCDASAFFNSVLRNRDIFTTTPKTRDKLIEKLDKFILANLEEPEKVGVMRSNSGAGYLSDINRLLERAVPVLGDFNYEMDVLPDNPNLPEMPIPMSKNGQAYLTYSMINRNRSQNFVNTTLGYLFSTSPWQGAFSTTPVIVTNLKPLGGTDFDNFFAFLHPSEMRSDLFTILHRRATYTQVTRIQDVAKLGGLDVYMQPSMLGEIAMISTGEIARNTWVANIPMVDPGLVLVRMNRRFMVEQFSLPGTDKYVSCIDWPFSMVRVVQHHIDIDLEHYTYLNEAITAYDARHKWTIREPKTVRPGSDAKEVKNTDETVDPDDVVEVTENPENE